MQVYVHVQKEFVEYNSWNERRLDTEETLCTLVRLDTHGTNLRTNYVKHVL
jgi:hypothetical protein